MKNRGQALVEFIIILPILLMIFMGMIDFGNILYKKYTLENDMDYVVDLYNNDNLYDIGIYANENSFLFSYKIEGNMVKINLKKNIKINTPILNEILGSPYKISVERTIYEE